MNPYESGPAFPVADIAKTQFIGITVRDYFAAAALRGICAQGDYGKHPKHKDDPWAASWAAHAYDYADAMLAERDKKEDV